jgi:hypothetical protein
VALHEAFRIRPENLPDIAALDLRVDAHFVPFDR